MSTSATIGTRVARPMRLVTAMLFLLASPACQTVPPVSSLDRAQDFVRALNAKNVEAMVQLTAPPFLYRNQEWKNAERGFTLGASTDRVLADANAMRSLFGQLVSTVRIERSTAARNPSPKSELIGRYLQSFEPPWTPLDLYVFLRGFGDVEHIAIVGVDPDSKMVRALYLN